MDQALINRIVEAALLAANQPLALAQLHALFPEEAPAPPGSVEAWARAPSNPVGGYYGLRKGYRGRFANYVPPVLELLGEFIARKPD